MDHHELSKKLGIPVEMIVQLEQWQTDELPEGVYLQGLLRRYAKEVGMTTGRLKRHFAELFGDDGPSVRPAAAKPARRNVIITKTVLAGVAVLAIFITAAYTWWQGSQLNASPDLRIMAPANGVVVQQETVQIEGYTNPGVEVRINGLSVLADPDGHFLSTVVLQEGANYIDVVAISALSRETSLVQTVYLES